MNEESGVALPEQWTAKSKDTAISLAEGAL